MAHRRIANICYHLQPSTSLTLASVQCESKISRSPSIETIILGDLPEAWRKAGFCVSARGETRIGSVCIRLLGTGGGLLGLALEGVSVSNSQHIFPGVPLVECKAREDSSGGSLTHPNGATSIGELVFYSQDVAQAAQSLEELGIPLFKPGVGLKPTPITGKHQQVMFLLGGIRIILLGPMDKDIPPDENPSFWMFPRTMNCPTVLMGWLPIVSDIYRLKAFLGDLAGNVKHAAQKGRRICTMAPERSKLTGTFAFLSDGDGSLFS